VGKDIFRRTRLLHKLRVIFILISLINRWGPALLSVHAEPQPHIDAQRSGTNTLNILGYDLSDPNAGIVALQTSQDLTNWITIQGPSTGILYQSIPIQAHGFFRVVAADSSPVFSISVSNHVASVASGDLIWANGEITHFNGGSVRIFDDITNYIVINLATLRVHALSRWIGDDSLLVGTVRLIPQAVPEVVSVPSIVVPPTRIGLAKGALMTDFFFTYIATMGTSLTGGAGTGHYWWELLFDRRLNNFGYNVKYPYAVRQLNYGVGGATAEYGLTLLGNAYYSELTPVGGWQNMSLVFDGYSGVGANFNYGMGSGQSYLLNQTPNLVLYEYGVDGATYEQDLAMEEAIRTLLNNKIEVLMITANANSNAPANNAWVGDLMVKLKQGYGIPIADTWAYVDELTRQGRQTYVDSVHQDQEGWFAWAEAVLGVLNPHVQEDAPPHLPAGRVLATRADDEPYFFSSADFVYTPDNQKKRSLIQIRSHRSSCCHRPFQLAQMVSLRTL
jgi:hypothetical protein